MSRQRKTSPELGFDMMQPAGKSVFRALIHLLAARAVTDFLANKQGTRDQSPTSSHNENDNIRPV